MDAQIHAALVGGGLGGVTVVVGVVGAEMLERARGRRSQLEASLQQVIMDMPRVLGYVSDAWSDPRDTGPGSSFTTEATILTSEITALIRNARWPLRNAKAIRDRGQTLALKVGAHLVAWYMAGIPVTSEELLELSGIAGDLSRLVYAQSDARGDDGAFDALLEAINQRPG